VDGVADPRGEVERGRTVGILLERGLELRARRPLFLLGRDLDDPRCIAERGADAVEARSSVTTTSVGAFAPAGKPSSSSS
jgi:hypothetical protein